VGAVASYDPPRRTEYETDEKLDTLNKDGLKTVATLNAPPDVYQVRTVVREG
jgi:hypothetical protein